MTRGDIMNAAAWQRDMDALHLKIREHKKKCKHWSLGDVYEVPKSDDRFTPDKYAKCEFCGEELKQ